MLFARNFRPHKTVRWLYTACSLVSNERNTGNVHVEDKRIICFSLPSFICQFPNFLCEVSFFCCILLFYIWEPCIYIPLHILWKPAIKTIILHCIVLYFIVSYRIASYHIISYYFISLHIVSWYILLHNIISYYIISYYISSHSIIY